jgi:hypothetical protein
MGLKTILGFWSMAQSSLAAWTKKEIYRSAMFVIKMF